jgi:LemA protein
MIGTATIDETAGRSGIVVKRDRSRGTFCMADGNEKKVLSSLAWSAYAALIFGPLLFAICFLYVGYRLNLSQGITAQIAFASVAAMYAYVASILATEFYNGMMVLRNNVERARANVDVLLKRRHDLIQNIVAVVSAAGKYERTITAEIARIRATAAEGDSRRLIMVAEGYPAIKSNENYLALSRELANTENWIAGARSYVADSVMLYNAKVSSFPYLLFAPFFGLKPMNPSAME